MLNNIVDPYEKIIQIEAEILELWMVNHQLSEQLKETSELNIKITKHLTKVGSAMTELTKKIEHLEHRIYTLETK